MGQRLGILGGAFNPVHLGHLLAARHALEALELDAVHLVPTGTSVFGKKLLPKALRLRLLQAAVKAWPGLEVNPIELQRPGLSFTVSTLKAYHQARKGLELYLLIGQDALQNIRAWHQSDQLPKLAHICVMGRDSGQKYNNKTLKRIAKEFDVIELNNPLIDISSTKIRDRWGKGLSLRGLVDERQEKLMIRTAYPQKFSIMK
jgi:nicotinate-nucleotide adenylyltransferase